MRCGVAALLLAVLTSLGTAWASTSDSKTATVNLTVEKYVALTELVDQRYFIDQDSVPGDFTSFGRDQYIYLRKNCDVLVSLDVTDMIPLTATANLGAQPLPVQKIELADMTTNPPTEVSAYYAHHVEQVFRWAYCTENGLGERMHVLYHWERNGLCDHAGLYEATITVTAIGLPVGVP